MKDGTRPEGRSWKNRASVQIIRTVEETLFSKWMFLALPLMLLPFFISLYLLVDPVEDIEQWPELFNIFSFLVYMQILFLMFSLIYGTSLVNEETESRTITYLFMRGSKRFEVVLYKFVGLYISLTLLLSISIILTYFTLSLHSSVTFMWDHIMQLIALLCSMLVGIFVYLSLFTLIGVIFKRPLVIGLIFSFFWEVFMVNVPLNVQQITIMYYIRSIYLGTDAVRRYTEIDEKAGVPGSILGLAFLGAAFLFLAFVSISRKDIN